MSESKGKITDDNIRLMTEAVKKQLETSGIDVSKLVPDAARLVVAIRGKQRNSQLNDTKHIKRIK